MEKDRFHKLLSKKLSGDISDIETDELQQAISKEEIYGRIDRKFTTYLEPKAKEEVNHKMLAQIWDKINEGHVVGHFDATFLRKRKYFTFLKAAAALFLIASAVVIAYQLTKTQAIAFVKVSTTNYKGFQILNDGTKVWLNHESEIRYNEDFGETKREIYLKGEAFFDVTKNQKVPLVVHAGEIDVKVKGTSFNVNAKNENEEIQVILVSGLIEVAKQERKKSIVVHPNQKLVFSVVDSNPVNRQFLIVNLSPLSLLKEISWKKDTIHFNKERLRDIILKLEKRYHVKITIESAQLKEKRFTGAIPGDRPIQEVLEVLKLSCSCGLSYSIKNNSIVIKD